LIPVYSAGERVEFSKPYREIAIADSDALGVGDETIFCPLTGATRRSGVEIKLHVVDAIGH
jgi:hypothetical protein